VSPVEVQPHSVAEISDIDESGELVILESPEGEDADEETPSAYEVLDHAFVYRGSGHPQASSWIIGTGDRLGIFRLRLVDSAVVECGQTEFRGNFAIHFVSGPDQTDLPPVIYELSFIARRRGQIADRWSYELSARQGLSTDFRVSLRSAWRFPAHAVLYYEATEFLNLVLGIDFPHRDDVDLLPVAGLVLRPHPNVRLDAVFPQPRVVFRTNEKVATYIGADFSGDMWAVGRDRNRADVATYHDFRVTLGTQSGTENGFVTITEIGYVFDRRLQYRSGDGDYKPLDTAVFRHVILY
jgi:hypothetical protein